MSLLTLAGTSASSGGELLPGAFSVAIFSSSFFAGVFGRRAFVGVSSSAHVGQMINEMNYKIGVQLSNRETSLRFIAIIVEYLRQLI